MLQEEGAPPRGRKLWQRSPGCFHGNAEDIFRHDFREGQDRCDVVHGEGTLDLRLRLDVEAAIFLGLGMLRALAFGVAGAAIVLRGIARPLDRVLVLAEKIAGAIGKEDRLDEPEGDSEKTGRPSHPSIMG